MKLEEIRNNPAIMMHLRFDLTSGEVLKPIGTKTEADLKEQAGFFFCIDVDNNSLRLVLVHMLPDGWGSPDYISDFPEDMLRDAIRDAGGDIKGGFYPTINPLKICCRWGYVQQEKKGGIKMDIEDIKNKALKELVMAVEKNDASATIGADIENALNGSSNDEELIQNWQGKLESLYQETQHYWGELENVKSGKQCIGEAVAMKEGIAVMTVQPNPPFSPQAPQNPPINLPGAIRHYLKARGIWQTIEDRFALNDEVSREVRKDTLRFGIEEKHRMGI